VTIPQRDDPRLEKIVKRSDSCKPLGMFRTVEDEFLLCYDGGYEFLHHTSSDVVAEFGLYVDKHGDPSRTNGTIEWEGTAERVALHSPYILLFDSRFIEIRHLVTGRLAQIIMGQDVRCLWDGGRQLNAQMVSAGSDGQDRMSQEARVHGVMVATDPATHPATRPSRSVAQHVFELVPTVPLYLPEKIASSSTSYSLRSSSPPRSSHVIILNVPF
jgi:hypothetical protein